MHLRAHDTARHVQHAFSSDLQGGEAFAEDGWDTIRVGGQVFEVTAPCQRCQMVCVDQRTGERTKEPLLALSSFRRHHGATYFGQHLRHCPRDSVGPPFFISVDDDVSTTDK